MFDFAVKVLTVDHPPVELEKESVKGLQALHGYCSGIGFLSPLDEHPQINLIEKVVKTSSPGEDLAVCYCQNLGGGFAGVTLPVALTDGEVVFALVLGEKVTMALIMHELVHYRQMSSGRLVTLFGKSSWEGKPIEEVGDLKVVKDVVDYFNAPWEIEAYREEHRYTPVWNMVPFRIWYQLRKLDTIVGIKLRKLFRKYRSK